MIEGALSSRVVERDNLESKGTGGNNGSSGHTPLDHVLGDGSVGRVEVGFGELAIGNSLDGGRDGLSERTDKGSLGRGEGGVVLQHRAGHLAGDLVGRLGLGTAGVALDEIRDQRADWRSKV